MSAGSSGLEVRVCAVRYEAERINSYELRRVDGRELPPFKAGAHIDLALPNGLSRSYSLANPERERGRYLIGVNHDRNSRGGSRFLHETVRVGDLLRISEPRNNFPLEEAAGRFVLIAGGIGITPLWCMIQRLAELGRRWELHYCARTRRGAAFVQEIQSLAARAGGLLQLSFDEETGGAALDLARIVAGSPRDSHLYCCGPAGLLKAFEAATEALPEDRVHVEYFSATEAAAGNPAAQGEFVVELARSQRTVRVPEGSSILDALLASGLDLPHSCTEGLCGSCEVEVLEGRPDHRDMVLTKKERAAGKSMMICCSGCNSEKLVLNL